MIIASAALALCVSLADGQTVTQTSTQTSTQSQTTDAKDLTTGTPQENAGSGRVAARAPGTWVQAAIARHSKLMAERLTAARFGQSSTASSQSSSSQTSTSSQSGLSGLAGLLSLASQAGSTGSLSGLSGLLSGLTGATTGTTTGFPAPANGTSYTLDDLIRLGQLFGGGTQTTTTTTTGGNTTAKSTTRQVNQTAAGGAIGRLPKPEQRFQQSTTSTTTAETDFKTRWANAMLQTFFSALTLGLQSSQFIDLVKDALRPLVLPTTENNDGNGSGNGSGNGIEDLDNDGGGGGSSTL
jgi:hypothetical protein